LRKSSSPPFSDLGFRRGETLIPRTACIATLHGAIRAFAALHIHSDRNKPMSVAANEEAGNLVHLELQGRLSRFGIAFGD
jgi:hypothetical protein